MRLLTVLLFGVFLVATQVFLVLKAMQDNLFERDVDPVDAVMERQASISDELTPQERLWLSKNHTVRVGVDPDFYPLEKFDAEGRYTGIGPDYLRILHKMTGLSFRIAPPSDWTNTIDMATSHKVDMYIAAAETQHRSQYMLFTPSYIVLPGIIMTRQPTKGESVTRGAATDETEPSIDGLKDLAGKRVAVVNRYSWHDFLEELHPEITPVPVKNTLEGLQKVAFGEVDAMIDYQFNITEKINNSGIRNLRAAGSIDAPYGHAFGIRKDWPELHSIINKALSKITPEERRIIAQKWLQPYEKKAFSKQTIWMMLFAAEVLFTVFAFVLYWNFSLKRQVSRRTAQLNQELAKYDRAEKELRESRAMLEQSNVELEHRVNERTRDLQAINAVGRSDVFLKLEVIKKGMGLTGLIIGAQFGPLVMISIKAVLDFFSTFVNAWPNKKLLGYSIFSQWMDIMPSLILSLVMSAVVYGLQFVLPGGPMVKLLLQIMAGMAVYGLLAWIFKMESFAYLVQTIKGQLQNRRKG